MVMQMGKTKQKRINPRRHPMTEADVEKAKKGAVDTALKLSQAIYLTVLKDRFGFDNDQIADAWQAMDKLSQEVVEGRINLWDLVTVLKEESNIDFK